MRSVNVEFIQLLSRILSSSSLVAVIIILSSYLEHLLQFVRLSFLSEWRVGYCLMMNYVAQEVAC